MARPRTTHPNVAGGNAAVFGSFETIVPPPRKRKTKTTLPQAVLQALAGAITTDAWLGDATMFFEGDDGQKNASNEARVYRRDLARYMDVPERMIRTRVWETEQGWQFALRLRVEGDNSAS